MVENLVEPNSVENIEKNFATADFYFITRSAALRMAKFIQSLPPDTIFSERHLIQSCQTGVHQLIEEVLKRTESPFRASVCLYQCFSGKRKDMLDQDKLKACHIFAPFVSPQEYEAVAHMATKDASPLCSSYWVSRMDLTFDQRNMFLENVLLRHVIELNPDPHHQVVDVLLEKKLPLIVSHRVIHLAYLAGLPFLEQILPFSCPMACHDYLKSFLNHIDDQKNAPLTEKKKRMIELAYNHSKDIFLSCDQNDLSVSLERDNHPFFWSVHDKHYLKQQLKSAINSTEHSSTLAPKRKI